MNTDEVLYDIGANIGTFSLYAGRKLRRVIAFEPHFANYQSLNINISLNGLADRVTAYNCALSDEEIVGTISLPLITGGTSGAQYRPHGQKDTSESTGWFHQGIVSLPLDRFTDLCPDDWFPNHVKLDVDGLEWRILQGMKKLLGDQRLRSIMVETANEERGRFATFLEDHGFVLCRDEPAGAAKIFYNCLFTRFEAVVNARG